MNISLCFMTLLLKNKQNMLKKRQSWSNFAAGKENSQLCMLQLLQACTKAHHSLPSQTKTTAFISAFRQLELSLIDKISERQVLTGNPTSISLTQMQGKQT